MTTHAELATALAFVLQKWKGTGADPVETKPFDELLERAKIEAPLMRPASTSEFYKTGDRIVLAPDDEPPPKRQTHFVDDEKLAILDAEIDAVNREANE